MTKHASLFAAINHTAPRRHKLNPLTLMVLLALSSASYSAQAGTCNPTLNTCGGTDVWDLSVNGAPAQSTTFTDHSIFNADVSVSMVHNLTFRNDSTFNATAPIVMGSSVNLYFYDHAVMNASVSNAISGGVQWINDNAVLNAAASNAIAGGTQRFYDNAVLNATASNAITGGMQYFYENAVLNATVSNAITGGTQRFYNNAVLNATASNAITGGTQNFSNNTVLNAAASNAITGGTQNFSSGGVLNAAASNAIAGGKQIFSSGGVLNATASNAIAGGKQTFSSGGVLNATASNVIAGGTQVFNNDSQLKIGADDAVAGSLVELKDNSQLLMQGHTAWVSSLAGNGGEVLGQGSTDSTLTINGTHGEDTTFAGVLLNNGGTLNLVKDGTSRQTLTGVGSTVQNIDVLGGTLAFAQNGTFTTVGDYTTHTGATTTIGVDNATLTVGGAFTQQAGSTLDITVGASPDITADTAVLGGQLVINGFADGPAPVKASATTTTTYNLIHTAHGISGNFDNNPLAPTGLDYLLHDGYLSNNDHDYDMRFGLAWTDGLQRQGTGSFTVNAGTAFDIDTALADQIVPTGGFASGWDGRSLTKAGDGLLVLSALNQYTGSTTVNGGTLRTDIADSLLSSREVTVNGGVLDLNGIDQRVQQLNLNNTGTLAFGKVNGRAVNAAAANAFTTLTVTGDYQGNNGLLSLNTRLGDDSSLSDKLVVEGNTAGTTRVQVNNAGGSGAQTLNGIEVVQVKGQSDGVFTQAGRIVAGAYDYFLGRGTGTQANNWVLNSRLSPLDPVNPDDPVNPVVPIERPEASGYIANLAAANTLFATRLHDRLGETQYIDALTGEQKVTSLWLRNEGGHNRFRDSRDQLGTQSNRYVMQLGGDIAQWTTDQDRFHLGVMGGYGNSKSRTDSRVTGYRSDASVDGYSLGMYGTWQANDADQTGLYVDGWAQYSWFDNSVSGQGLASEHYQSKGVTASVESGYTVKVGENAAKTAAVFIQPQAQVTWMGVKADEHKEANGTQVSGKGDGNIQTRLGVKAFMNGSGAQDKGKDRVFQPFIEANWVHNTQDFGTQMDGVTVSQAGAGNIAELKTGVEGQLNKRVNLWGNVSQQLGDQGYSDTAVMLGVKVNF